MQENPFSHAFIDGANLWQACSRDMLNFNMDFKKLGAWLVRDFNCVRLNYYTAVRTDDEGRQTLRKLLDWLSYNSYNVIEKPARFKGHDDNGKAQYKGNMDIEIAVDCARLIHNTTIRRVVLFSGDSDFEPVVRYMQEYGTHVTIVSTNQTQPPILAESLRKSADAYIDLADLIDVLRNDHGKGE